ncbi:hypothetical protein AMTRI_Chr05g69270 [Amborella trichopoda]
MCLPARSGGRPNPIVQPRTKDSSQFASIVFHNSPQLKPQDHWQSEKVKGNTFEEVPTIAKPQYHLSTNFLLIKLMSSTSNSFISFGQNFVPPKQMELIYDDSLFLRYNFPLGCPFEVIQSSNISSEQPLSLQVIIISSFGASSCVQSLLVKLVNFASIVC